ncbi:hypothetical protein NM208_g563 [Fusarium decemcellulare]|uniref:Uncharacterized protein n=2 Tax=Fusarium decemcellulare TaxID=57161 RepID=A0ACC1SYG6_9HYPO|nr:hypothetical protein NM208_g750 [Fusarium decemcellulare]KAJ3549314.1 hypothetical protein NM208_g563 [Fusarium decemcellulare]
MFALVPKTELCSELSGTGSNIELGPKGHVTVGPKLESVEEGHVTKHTATMKVVFDRLVRFENPEGLVFYGEAPTEDDMIGKRVKVYDGSLPWSLSNTDDSRTQVIQKILSPIPKVPIIYGIGLNYKTHIAEASLEEPKYPTVFTKAPKALNDPFSDILIHPECLCMDYEGELTVILGRDTKNVKTDEEALGSILGYTVGNDVSSRYWQMPERSNQQHGYAKSFDGFAPIGPVLVSPAVINPERLTLKTYVNGDLRQDARVQDLFFKIADIIKFLSRGTTLMAGTAIMTGTPSGVAAFSKPPRWIKHGDVVEVTISKIGTIRNKYVFIKETGEL